jgi:hypothetical protein
MNDSDVPDALLDEIVEGCTEVEVSPDITT